MSQGRRFELKQRIGAGAYGEVFLAEQHSSDTGFHRVVALKVLHPHHHDVETQLRIRDEARILGHIRHRSVVTAYDLVRLGERWAVLMDYVPGCDLQELLLAKRAEREAVPAAAALEIGAEIARALHAAWTATDEQGRALLIVHRDIKPSNVRLTPDGDIKVLDFGIAKVQLGDRESYTGDQILGTLAYMAPEQQNGGVSAPAGDVYALAKVLIELLLGQSITRSPADESAHESWAGAQLSAARDALANQPATASMVLPILTRCLSFHPRDRPRASELAEQLDALARSAHGASLRPFAADYLPQIDRILERTPTPASGVLLEVATGQQPLPLPTAPAASSSSRLLAAGVVLSLVLGATAIGVGLLYRPASQPPRAPNVLVVEGPREPALQVEATSADAPEVDAPIPQPARRVLPSAPRPAPAPEPATPPAPSVEAAPTPSPEPTSAPAPAPVAAPPAPKPPPELRSPSAAASAGPPPDLTGIWTGTATGRPITFRLASASEGIYDGRIELIQGTTVRSFPVLATVAPGGEIAISGRSSGVAFEGTLSGASLSGQYRVRAGARWQATEVTRD